MASETPQTGTADAERPSLSALLRERTAALHAEAERTGVVNDILRRKSDRRGYGLLIRNLLPAYSEMEQALSGRSRHPAWAAFLDPALHRAPRLANDLAVMFGDRWASALPLLPEGERYAARVAQSGEGDGVALIAHAYVRYFGDLSGGQVLKRMLGASLGLPPEALSHYDFPNLDVDAAKSRMREAIDRDVPVARHELVIAEAQAAFSHNIAISNAIQRLAAEAKPVGLLQP
jgi:heme oxygenase